MTTIGLTKQQREETWRRVVATANEPNATVRERSHAQLLALLLIADSLDDLAGRSA